MVITPHFVFLHLPKTGGNFVQRLCQQHLPAGWLIEHDLGSHASWRQIPPAQAGLPRFGVIRNPWDWYVSWDAYLREQVERPELRRSRNEFWRSASDNGRRGFRETVLRAVTGDLDDPAATVLKRDDIDLLTLRFRTIFGSGAEHGEMDIGRTELLRFDFSAFLWLHEIPVPETFHKTIRRKAPTNASRRADYQSYYDDEVREAVGHKARELIARYGYRFESLAPDPTELEPVGG